MANPEQFKILKRGVKVWNDWRARDPKEIHTDLRGVNLHRAALLRVDFRGTDLRGADLRQSKLRGADFRRANLYRADLRRADLHRADLTLVDLSGANLREANLSGANLYMANLRGAVVGYTTFADVDLSLVKGLNTIKHEGPSTIGIDTVYRSEGKIPESFLRRSGVPEPFIVNMKSLVAAMSSIEFYSCFISYSSRDQEFAERLYADLQAKGVRCWFAPEDLKIGDKFRQRIDEAIRFHDKLLVVLSEASVNSTWVEEEVEAAFAREDKEKQLVLFPVRLDDAVMNTSKAWAATLKRMRHIGDFTKWQDHNSYQKGFQRLLRDLQGDQRKEAANP